MKNLIFVLAITIFLTACTPNNTYVGFHYKNAVFDANIYSQQIRLDNAPKFSSLQACITWGKNLLTSNPRDGYECSKDCRIDGEWGIVCKDTTKMITTGSNTATYENLF